MSSILILPIVLALSLSVASSLPAAAIVAPATNELVILADPQDPYYSLAQEIAAAENAPIAPDLPAALAMEPTFLIWVAAPEAFSDEAMVAFGLAMKGRESAISSGIISATTLAGARRLWERRNQVSGEDLYAANAANPAAHIDEGRILAFTAQGVEKQPLSEESFIQALGLADYLTFTGHGASSYLRIDEQTTIAVDDLPAMDAVVISTGSCQTFRLWKEDSIALGFADQGAAAYAGFVFSPNEGYLIGEFDSLPFRYTWPEFPIGHVIQVQNRGAMQGYASFPFQHLLGDPRIALGNAAPYTLVEDRQDGTKRILSYTDVPAGAIPIRIPGGAAYEYVKVLNGSAAARGDLFYNSKLQMVDIQADKYILLIHPGGDLTLRLRQRAPWYWYPVDTALDSLDDTLVFSPQSGGDILTLIFAVIPLVWVGWQAFKKRLNRKKVWAALAVGAGVMLLQGAYVLLRIDQATIISKAVAFSPLSIPGAGILGACGALIFLQAKSIFGKISGMLVITFIFWSPLVFGLVMVEAFNRLGFIPHSGTGLYNHALGLAAAPAFFLALLFYGLVMGWVRKRVDVR